MKNSDLRSLFLGGTQPGAVASYLKLQVSSPAKPARVNPTSSAQTPKQALLCAKAIPSDLCFSCY